MAAFTLRNVVNGRRRTPMQGPTGILSPGPDVTITIPGPWVRFARARRFLGAPPVVAPASAHVHEQAEAAGLRSQGWLFDFTR